MYKNKSLRAQVLDLAVNEELTIPVTLYGYTTIRSYASELGFAANRKYKTSRNKEARTYTIKRIS
jgi:hypothetical protein